ncbi:hypothetical protein [Maritimibacter sp. DP1N21-5]|uniref:hypothetical protein n=1 Tax=Maritimibacter sp. DP1N21-5 TaxID=2836867 RepID=UPI001C465EC4|nr:hypothetical protein [Maritimibacter sp. DP1N21-5]MBV7409191.1 hypothetical protein [Maritimibacter sp. DP1N21-5]
MDMHARAERLASLMEERLDIRGQGLRAKLRRAGRKVPRWVRREIEALLEALDLSEHPKLAARVDHGRIESGTSRVERWLLDIDPWDRRRGVAVEWGAGLAFNLLLVVAIFVALLGWRGFL